MHTTNTIAASGGFWASGFGHICAGVLICAGVVLILKALWALAHGKKLEAGLLGFVAILFFQPVLITGLVEDISAIASAGANTAHTYIQKNAPSTTVPGSSSNASTPSSTPSSAAPSGTSK